MKTIYAIVLAVFALCASPVWAQTPPTITVVATWEDRSEDEDGFVLERKVDSGVWGEAGRVAQNSVTITDATLTLGHTYTYRVRAFNRWGVSEPSNEASVAPITPTPPQNMRLVITLDTAQAVINVRTKNPK